jgi:hypothetical protein
MHGLKGDTAGYSLNISGVKGLMMPYREPSIVGAQS